MTVDLRPCPFCGSSAEMSLNNFRYRHNTRCKSQIDALEKLEEYKNKDENARSFVGLLI